MQWRNPKLCEVEQADGRRVITRFKGSDSWDLSDFGDSCNGISLSWQGRDAKPLRLHGVHEGDFSACWNRWSLHPLGVPIQPFSHRQFFSTQLLAWNFKFSAGRLDVCVWSIWWSAQRVHHARGDGGIAVYGGTCERSLCSSRVQEWLFRTSDLIDVEVTFEAPGHLWELTVPGDCELVAKQGRWNEQRNRVTRFF